MSEEGKIISADSNITQGETARDIIRLILQGESL